MGNHVNKLKKMYSGRKADKKAADAKRGGQGPAIKANTSAHVRTMQELTPRDYDILHYLSFGPSNVSSLAILFFPARQVIGEKNTGVKGAANGVAAGSHASIYVFQRLRQMAKAELIQMEKYDLEGSAIVVLQKRGAEYVVRKFGAEFENIKCTLPKQSEIKHDIMVASSLRKIVYNEARELNLYKVNWFKTEHFMRRSLGRAVKKGDKTHFPDFALEIYTPKSSAQIFNFEVDAGSMGRSVVYDKLAAFKQNVVFIVETADRMGQLSDYLQADKRTRGIDSKKGIIRLPETILFVLWQDFIRKGCRAASFFSFPSGQKVKLPVAFT
jgi:hypothetical protein